jgi:hypothetical protein
VFLDAFQTISNPTYTSPGSRTEQNLEPTTADIRWVTRMREHQVSGIPVTVLVTIKVILAPYNKQTLSFIKHFMKCYYLTS